MRVFPVGREVGSFLSLPLSHIMLTSLVAECYPRITRPLYPENDSIQKVHTTDEFICYPELRSLVDDPLGARLLR